MAHKVDDLLDVTCALYKHSSAKNVFKQFLLSLGYSNLISNIMIKEPGKFAYSELLRSLIKFDSMSLIAVVKILSTLHIATDPTEFAS